MSANFATVALVRFPLLPSITSRELADQLGIEHKEVLRKIRKSITGKTGNSSVGGETPPTYLEHTYLDKQGKSHRQYLLKQKDIVKLAVTLGIAEGVLYSIMSTMENLIEQNFQLIQKQLESKTQKLLSSSEENSKLKAKLKKRETVGSGEEITHYKTDENGRVSKIVSNPSDFTDVELLEAMLSICYVQEKGRARQVANLEQMLRDRGRGIVQPCKYYKTKTVWAKFLD